MKALFITAMLVLTPAYATQVEPSPCEDPTQPDCDPVIDPGADPEGECEVQVLPCLLGLSPLVWFADQNLVAEYCCMSESTAPDPSSPATPG